MASITILKEAGVNYNIKLRNGVGTAYDEVELQMYATLQKKTTVHRRHV